MKIYSSKKTDEFYIPVTNASCDSALSYRVSVEDPFGILSIDQTQSQFGTLNNIYFSVPPLASFQIEDGTLVATCKNSSGSNSYYIEIQTPSYSRYSVYGEGQAFYLFSKNGTGLAVEIKLIGRNGQFPRFSVSQFDLLRLTNGVLPAPQNYVSVAGAFNISREEVSRSYLRVATNTDSSVEQTAKVQLHIPGKNTLLFEFIVKAEPSKFEEIAQPPISEIPNESLQLARAFVPMSGTQTIQVDSEGRIFLDKLGSSSKDSKLGFRRRCTNLGYAKDVSNLFSGISKDSVFLIESPEQKYSASDFSEQYFTEVNSGVEMSLGTQESLKAFAPIWLKGRVPKHFAIFRRPVDRTDGLHLNGSELVKVFDLEKTELWAYLNDLTKDPNFFRPPVEVDAASNYKVTWNGFSVESGDWSQHIEFLGSEIQSGLSDFEFNELITDGFKRGFIACPNLINIEFLFDDQQANQFEVFQYYGLYCDSLNMGEFDVNVDKTVATYRQIIYGSPTNSNTSDCTITNPEGVGLVLQASRSLESRFTSKSCDAFQDKKLLHAATIYPESIYSKKMVIEASTGFNPTILSSLPFIARLEDAQGVLKTYVTVASCDYNPATGIVTMGATQNDYYSETGEQYFVRFFDFVASESGILRLDARDSSKSSCMVFTSFDALQQDTSNWVDASVGIIEDFRKSITLIDSSSNATLTVLPKSVEKLNGRTRLFFKVMESNGFFSDGGSVSIDSLNVGSSVVFPPKSLVESQERKFVLSTKKGWHSIKSLDVKDYGDFLLGNVRLDSKSVSLDGSVGAKTVRSVPAERVNDYVPSVKFTSGFDVLPMEEGDLLILERKTKGSKKRWNIVCTSSTWNGESIIGGWSRQVSRSSVLGISIDVYDGYVKLEAPNSVLHPSFDLSYIIRDESSGVDHSLELLDAETDGTNFIAYFFSSAPTTGTYTTITAEMVEASSVSVPRLENGVRFLDIVASLRGFSSCPFGAAMDEDGMHIWLWDKTGTCSVSIVSRALRSGSLSANYSRLKQKRLSINDRTLESKVYTIELENAANVYSIPEAERSYFSHATKVLPKTGNYSSVNTWKNGVSAIPDAMYQAQGRKQGSIVSFDSDPLLLNGRLQIVEQSRATCHLLSFLRYVDLNFFDELPFLKNPGSEAINESILRGDGFENRSLVQKRRDGLNKDASTSNMLASTSTNRGKTRPTVGRWKRAGSTNCNFAPYTLNVDPDQLQNDSFTGIGETGKETSQFSLDFYIITGWPISANDSDQLKYDYLGKRVDKDRLKSADYDFFTDYLTVGEGNEGFSNGSMRASKTLWSKVFRGTQEGQFETMFKGLPLNINSKVDLDGYRFCALLQVEKDADFTRRIDLIVNEKWKAVTLLVSLCIDGPSVDGSLTFDELYNISSNKVNSKGVSPVYGPMLVYATPECLSFDRVVRMYNAKKQFLTNTPSESEVYDSSRSYEYSEETTIEIDVNSPMDIELTGVAYLPMCDYVIKSTMFTGSARESQVTISIPRSRIRGVYDPAIKSTRTFIDGSYSDAFFGSICDSLTGPICTKLFFSTKDSVYADGPMRLFGPNSVPVDMQGVETKLYSAKVYAIGEDPFYGELTASCTAEAVLSSISNGDFFESNVLSTGDSVVGITSLTYSHPEKLKPLRFKTAEIDSEGNVFFVDKKNSLNVFRVDGPFEPSYSDVILYAATEDPLLTRQLLNSYANMNTRAIGLMSVPLWYRRVSKSGIDSSVLNVNGTLARIDSAIGRKYVSPTIDTWGDAFYSFATDVNIDQPRSGLERMHQNKFFLSSKASFCPVYIECNTYSAGLPEEDASVTYVATIGSVSLNINWERLLYDDLFSRGVFSFFDALSEKIDPYSASGEYIRSSLISMYSVDSIEVYQRPFGSTQVFSLGRRPVESDGFRLTDKVSVQSILKQPIKMNLTVDGSKQVCLSFNINRT